MSALAPQGHESATWEVGVSESKYRYLINGAHELRLARLQLVAQVLADPISISRGWNRPATDDCIIYVGRPERDFRTFSIETPAPPGHLFVVFVLPDGTIDDWTWRPAVADDPTRPEGIEENSP